jgi:hypothetical protein
MAKKKDPLDAPEAALAKMALAYPEVTEDHPWGERAFKVKGKVFLFLSRHEGGLNATVKLPQSNTYALTQPFAKWIEQLALEGVTAGCGPTTYCPDARVTRGPLAVFVVRTFDLPM